jgi:cell division protein FtsN
MSEEKEGYQKDFDFDELDREVGLGDILKERDNSLAKFMKNIGFLVLLFVVGGGVFWGSLKLGEKIFVIQEPEMKDFLSNRITDNEAPKNKTNAIEKPNAKKINEIKKVKPSKKNKTKATNKPNKVKKTVAQKKATTKQTAAKKADLPKTNKTLKVIVGSFGSQLNAINLKNKLAKKNIDTHVTFTKDARGGFYRVIALETNSFSKVKTKMKTLAAQGQDSFYISEK